LTLCLALGVLPAFGGWRDNPNAPVTLYTEFQQQPPDSVLDAIQDELDLIMAPAGLHFGWFPLSQAGSRVSAQLAVVHFKGECDAEELTPDGGYPGPLGWTHISDGEILPFIDVNCAGVRIFVQRDLLAMPAATREGAFGRAIARILAHELYHLLANTRSHAGKGVARAYYSVTDLLAQTLQFGRKESDALRSKTAHLSLQPPVQGQ